MVVNFYDMHLSDSGRVALVKERGVAYEGAERMDNPEEIAEMATNLLTLDRMAEEYVYMLALDCVCHVMGIFMVSKGTVNLSVASPREIYIRALAIGAVKIVLFHNHPSGSALPSEEDLRLTERVKGAGELVGIPLADHIIIGAGGSYLSFCEQQIL